MTDGVVRRRSTSLFWNRNRKLGKKVWDIVQTVVENNKDESFT